MPLVAGAFGQSLWGVFAVVPAKAEPQATP